MQGTAHNHRPRALLEGRARPGTLFEERPDVVLDRGDWAVLCEPVAGRKEQRWVDCARGDRERGEGRRLLHAAAAADTFPQLVKDTQAAFQYASDTYHTYELWGRKPVYEMVRQTGSDETAQRADALKVIDMKPFMVMDISDDVAGAPVFSATRCQPQDLVASSSTTPETGAQQSPYRWNYGGDQTASVPLAASFVGRSLSGKKASSRVTTH